MEEMQGSEASQSSAAPVFTSVQEAMKVARQSCDPVESVGMDVEKLRAACEYLVERRSELKELVFVQLPRQAREGVSWDKFRAGAIQRCRCDKDWMIKPAGIRSNYEAAEVPVVLTSNKKVYLKPAGADNSSAYISLCVESDVVTFDDLPLAPKTHEQQADKIFAALGLPLLSTKSYALSDVSRVLGEGEKLIWTLGLGPDAPPLFELKSVNLDNLTITIVPDKDVEVFTLDASVAVPAEPSEDSKAE